jgi:hypothetical protein
MFLVWRQQLEPGRARLCAGQFIVDLHNRNDCTYYAISKTGSNDILSIGHESTIEEAEASALWTIAQLILVPETSTVFAEADEQSA